MDDRLAAILDETARRQGRIVVLTGAGVSAESGIPTFRGPEGYWTVGAQAYQPQEMATRAMFERLPEDVWAWYLYRRGVCRAANPNAGHLAIVRLERAILDRFRLLTQNVDGLHLVAGSSPERTYQVHGNISFRRCARECGAGILPVPEEIPAKAKGGALTAAERELLRCPACGGWSRPHVLWFDECYDEERYRYQSALAAAREADLLLVVGTSGATTLPVQAGQLAARSGAAIVDVNPEANPFRELALSVPRGAAASGRSAELLPGIVERLLISKEQSPNT